MKQFKEIFTTDLNYPEFRVINKAQRRKMALRLKKTCQINPFQHLRKK